MTSPRFPSENTVSPKQNKTKKGRKRKRKEIMAWLTIDIGIYLLYVFQFFLELAEILVKWVVWSLDFGGMDWA
jgi:hypothetical protein